MVAVLKKLRRIQYRRADYVLHVYQDMRVLSGTTSTCASVGRGSTALFPRMSVPRARGPKNPPVGARWALLCCSNVDEQYARPLPTLPTYIFRRAHRSIHITHRPFPRAVIPTNKVTPSANLNYRYGAAASHTPVLHDEEPDATKHIHPLQSVGHMLSSYISGKTSNWTYSTLELSAALMCPWAPLLIASKFTTTPRIPPAQLFTQVC